MNIKETIGDIIRNAMDERITRLNEEKEEIENELMGLIEAQDSDLSDDIDYCRDQLLEINGIINPLSEVFESLNNGSSAYKAIIEALFYDDSDDLLDLLWEALEEVNISENGWKKIKMACLNLRNEDVLEARISEVLKEEGGFTNE